MKNKQTWRKKSDTAFKVLAVTCVALVSVVAVLAVRAYLNAQTDEKHNKFSSMTYTNIAIEEPELSLDIQFHGGEDGFVTKDAEIVNVEGGDKKPVYLRTTVVTTVYNNKGENVSFLYPDVYVDWSPGSIWDWTRRDGYWYYNQILLPGEATSKLFHSSYGNEVQIINAEQLPSYYKVHVTILADAVQAVSTDSANWSVGDYYDMLDNPNNEVQTAWGVTPTLPLKEPDPEDPLQQSLEDLDISLTDKASVWCGWPWDLDPLDP